MVYRLKANQHKHYQTIPIETLRDTRLSAGARSLLFYLLSHDRTYAVNYEDICAATGVKYRASLKLMNELIEYEYVTRECHRDAYDKQRFFWTYEIYSLPRKRYLHIWRKAKEREYQREVRKNSKKVKQIRSELWGHIADE